MPVNSKLVRSKSHKVAIFRPSMLAAVNFYYVYLVLVLLFFALFLFIESMSHGCIAANLLFPFKYFGSC